MILVSSCLVGMHCRYDCKANTVQWVVDLVARGLAVPVCPEQLGGLSTPRVPAEIQSDSGKVMTKCGKDVSAAFQLGGITRFEYS